MGRTTVGVQSKGTLYEEILKKARNWKQGTVPMKVVDLFQYLTEKLNSYSCHMKKNGLFATPLLGVDRAALSCVTISLHIYLAITGLPSHAWLSSVKRANRKRDVDGADKLFYVVMGRLIERPWLHLFKSFILKFCPLIEEGTLLHFRQQSNKMASSKKNAIIPKKRVPTMP